MDFATRQISHMHGLGCLFGSFLVLNVRVREACLQKARHRHAPRKLTIQLAAAVAVVIPERRFTFKPVLAGLRECDPNEPRSFFKC